MVKYSHTTTHSKDLSCSNIASTNTPWKSPISAITEFESRKSPWRSIWLCNALQLLDGIQFSIFFSSMLPYLRALDPTAPLAFYGWIVAVFPLGQTIASFLFGIWNQKTKSAKWPVAVGITLMGIGNCIYGTLPFYQCDYKWIMLMARFIVGFGAGNLSVLRTYVACASTPRDKMKALSLGIGMYNFGFCIGPAAMLVFTPLGKDGFRLGWFPVTMYNSPAFAMVIVSIISLLVLFTCFQEEYAGIINNDQKNENTISKDQTSSVVVPKFNKLAAIICIAVWFVHQCICTNFEVLMVPTTMSAYNWNNEQAILNTGFLVFASAGVTSFVSFILGCTRIGKIDRRILLGFGIIIFMFYHLLIIPWPFYSGPLDYMPLVGNSTDASRFGGCLRAYEWCAHTTRVPLTLYIFSNVILAGVAFPLVGTPCGALFAEILGPRNQGFMQGSFAFFGSIGRFAAPVVSTYLFESGGYLTPTAVIVAFLIVTLATVAVFRRKLVPLRLIPPIGIATPYKTGFFYRL